MQIDPLTIFAVGGVASLLIERIFYYKSKYKQKNSKPENPSHGERIASLEKGQESNEKDHELIRKDIAKLFNFMNGAKR